MHFSTLCNFFDSVRQVKSPKEKRTLIKDFLKTAREGNDSYQVLRLVVPKIDRDRPSYRMKEAKIGKLIIKMLSLQAGNKDYNILSKPLVSGLDFGDVIYTVLKRYIVKPPTSSLSIVDINSNLDRIANRSSDSGLDDLLLALFRKLSPSEIKWFVQLLLKELKLGLSEISLLNCYHPDAGNYFQNNSNLKHIAEVFQNPEVSLEEISVTLFTAFRPMLSKRVGGANFNRCFPSDCPKLYVETKFDGERFQLHMRSTRFKYFSRNGFDYTDFFGPDFENGLMTPFLSNVFPATTHTLILDGEMMLWNTKTLAFGSKGMSFDVKKLHAAGKYRPCFVVFDIRQHNDEIVANKPLSHRLKLLRHVVQSPIDGVIILSQFKELQSRDEIVASLNDAVDNNEEGLIVKNPKSVYKCSERNGGWYKIKMEYFDDVVHDLDLVVMGGSYGNPGYLNSFMVGIVSNDTYLSLGSVSSGLNSEQLDLLNEHFKIHGCKMSEFEKKSEGKLLFGREVPDIFVEPRNAIVLQVRATELTRSTSDAVKTPYTFRFPRVLKIREDKPAKDCLSIKELLELTKDNKAVIKLNKRHLQLEEIQSKERKKRKVEQLQDYKVLQERIAAESGNFLSGKKFYVFNSDEFSIANVNNSIKKAGGDICYKFESNLDIVLVATITSQIEELMRKTNCFDIISLDWIKRVLNRGALLDYEAEEIISRGMNYRQELGDDFDFYGDSFTQPSDRASLERIFALIHKRDLYLNTNNNVCCDF